MPSSLRDAVDRGLLGQEAVGPAVDDELGAVGIGTMSVASLPPRRSSFSYRTQLDVVTGIGGPAHLVRRAETRNARHR